MSSSIASVVSPVGLLLPFFHSVTCEGLTLGFALRRAAANRPFWIAIVGLSRLVELRAFWVQKRSDPIPGCLRPSKSCPDLLQTLRSLSTSVTSWDHPPGVASIGWRSRMRDQAWLTTCGAFASTYRSWRRKRKSAKRTFSASSSKVGRRSGRPRSLCRRSGL